MLPGNERIEVVRKLLERNERVLPRGGGTKPALSTPARGETVLDMTGMSGVIEYYPEEFTFTALAGTRLADIISLLSNNGQYLPFDPPLVGRGATLGGTVASGLSGSGRFRFGGIRDFILGVRFIDGRGELISAGGKVVKNVAGLDFPKLMVGSLGGLGILVELTFKVFPKPEACLTWKRKFESLGEALQVMQTASQGHIPLEALDLEALDPGYCLWVRIGGFASILQARMDRLMEMVGTGTLVSGDEELECWRQVGEFSWVPEGDRLIKIALTPRRIQEMENQLAGKSVLRRYAAGGQLAWLALADTTRQLEPVISQMKLPGLVIWGAPGFPHLGEFQGLSVLRRVKDTFDPAHRFVEI